MNLSNTTRMLLAVLLSASIASAQKQNSATPKPAADASAKPVAQPASAVHGDDGGKKFDQNCSRCHNAPENINPRITGTVLRHMRVRATLSAQDEKDILRFLNQ
jgi:cytochrome c5